MKVNREMQSRQAEMQVQYDALLEMFGQKVKFNRQTKREMKFIFMF